MKTSPARISCRGIFPFIETSYTVPSTLLRISKLGLGGSIVYVSVYLVSIVVLPSGLDSYVGIGNLFLVLVFGLLDSVHLVSGKGRFLISLVLHLRVLHQWIELLCSI